MNALHPATTPVLAVACVLVRMALEQLGPAYGEAWQRGIEVATGALTIGVFLQFSAGDPPRRPWSLLMITLVLFLVGRLASWLGLMVGGIKLAHLVFIAGNLTIAASMIGFNRVLGSSELLSERTEADRWRALAFLGLLAVAAVAALGWNTWEVAGRGRPEGAAAWVGAILNIVSTLADVVVCAGGVYLVWLVRPLLGGSLARPYLLLAVSAGAALVGDFLLVAAGASVQTELTLANLSAHLVKWVGCLSYALIGLAAATQLWLLRSAGRRPRRA